MKLIAPVAPLLLVACASAPQPGELSENQRRQALGPAVIAAFNDMCGADRIDQFQASYVAFASGQSPLDAAQVAKINTLFKKTNADARARFKTEAERAAYCRDYPADQALIDRGISGDFSGMI